MLSIEPIPAFQDNYIWCLHQGGEAWVVDPGAAAPVEAFLAARALQLRGILLTHHHSDHTGGVLELVRRHNLETVYGPRNPTITGITHPLIEGDRIRVLALEFGVLEVPGHTLDHIAYFTSDTEPPSVFCGDTLFAAGCGRLFEGSPAQMHASLQKLAGLAGATAVYCTHEYTLANLRFALAVEPENRATRARTEAASQRREQQLPTLPSTMQLELETNPFLRTDAAAVRAAAQKLDPAAATNTQIFAAIRSWKDRF